AAYHGAHVNFVLAAVHQGINAPPQLHVIAVGGADLFKSFGRLAKAELVLAGTAHGYCMYVGTGCELTRLATAEVLVPGDVHELAGRAGRSHRIEHEAACR